MKISNEVIEAARAAEQVILPNRYQRPFINAFQELTGEEVPEMQGRKLTVRSNGRTYRWIRGRNIPEVIGSLSKYSPNILTVGLTGSEWCIESEATTGSVPVRWDNMTEESFGTLALIAPERFDLEKTMLVFSPPGTTTGRRVLNVVTTFPETVQTLSMTDRFIFGRIFSVDGGVEGVADALGMAAVDLVSTGKTLEENNFTILEELMPVYPALVQTETKGEQ